MIVNSNRKNEMPTILKDGSNIGRYLIIEELHRGAFFNCHKAIDTDGKIKECELLQYKSPVPSTTWFKDYVDYLKRVSQKISDDQKLSAVCCETLELFIGDSEGHPELFRVVPPSPIRLEEYLDADELSGDDRFGLARSIAEGLASLHLSGLTNVPLAPASIGVRNEVSPVFLELDWVRLIGEPAPWDGYQGDVGYPDYMAPELQDSGRPTTASDVFSLGCLLVRLLTVNSPAEKGGIAGTGDICGSIVFRVELPEFDRLSAMTVLQACLDKDPDARPTAEAVSKAFGPKLLPLTEKPSKLLMVPRWLQQSLQTLAFWVAYQNEVYRHCLLPEGAIVAELTRLLDATIDSGMVVIREPMYRIFLPQGKADWKQATRADLAVIERSQTPESMQIGTVIEVKRAIAKNDVIDEDLIALSLLKKANPKIRAFLVVVSQVSIPDRWVGESGKADPETSSHDVSLESGVLLKVLYRVRRVAKAAASFDSKWRATYCCLVEVL